MRNLLKNALNARAPRTSVRLRLEELENRTVPSATSGNAWPSPQLITLSFEPDGTVLGINNGVNITSNLFAKLNSHPGWTTATWENQIIKAAQAWAQQTNINFQVVSDNGASIGSGNNQQGDPGFGDIRIGGYAMGTTLAPLATAYQPPPVNNYSIAGDIAFNTSLGFNIGTTYDLYTVAMHEIGHALGMEHSLQSSAVMFGLYNGVKAGPTSDDAGGIRSIYSGGNARSADAYDAAASNNSFATATDLTSQIDPVALTSLQTGLDVTTTSDSDFYTFTAPSATTGTLTVNVQTAGLSLLRQSVKIYAADQTTVLASGSSAGSYNGTTISLTVSGITAGQVFYVKVAGADTTAFGTGAYAMTLNFGSGASPTVPLPNTTLANGNPLQSGGGESLFADPHSDGRDRESIGWSGLATNFTTLVKSLEQTHSNPALLQAIRADLEKVDVKLSSLGKGTSSEKWERALDAVFSDPKVVNALEGLPGWSAL